MREHWLTDLGALALLFAAFLGARATLTRLDVDPDWHYHVALSRETAQRGLVRALPQAEDLGWNVRFIDKEFLFHQLTALGFRVAGERGSIDVGVLLSLLAIAMLYVACRAGADPFRAAAGTTLAFACGSWLFRVSLFRPHVFGIAMTLAMVAALLRRRARWAALCGLLFALGYHAVFAPAAIVALFIIGAHQEPGDWKAGAAALTGIAAGILVNPYFPANVHFIFDIVRIALSGGAGGGGTELAPLPPVEFLLSYAGPVVALVVAAMAFARERHRGPLAFLVASSLLFWLAAIKSPRATEYAVPLTAIAFALSLSRRSTRVTSTSVAVVALASLPSLARVNRTSDIDRYLRGIVRAVEAIPPSSAPTKLLNCSFDEGEVLLHLRPEIHFIDALDPNLLRFRTPDLAQVRDQLIAGTRIDPLETVTDVFHADGVICGHLTLTGELDRDPWFQRIWPSGPGPLEPATGPAVYRVAPTIPFVSHWAVGMRTPRSQHEMQSLSPTDSWPLRALAARRYADLSSERPPAPVSCALFRVGAEDRSLAAGRDVLAVGGGPSIRLWIDGHLAYESGILSQPRLIDALVTLSKPLTGAEGIEAIVCGPRSSNVFGAALGFTTRAQLTTIRANGSACLAPEMPAR